MQRHEAIKKGKGSGKAIIATARKIAVIIWNMLTGDEAFNMGLMIDRKLAKKSESMGGMAGTAKEAVIEGEEKPVITKDKEKGEGVKRTHCCPV